MNTKAIDSLRHVEIFSGMSDSELVQIARLCKVYKVAANQIIFKEGSDGDELFIIQSGCVRVSINTRGSGDQLEPGTINMLYTGQSFGEMVLLGGATRSASVSSMEACVLLVIQAREFSALCEMNPRIGYRVMHNLASDLAYKLRSSNLLLRGNIRWQRNELSRRSSR